MGGEVNIHYPSVVSTRTEMPERETFRKLGSTWNFTLNPFEMHMQGSSQPLGPLFSGNTDEERLGKNVLRMVRPGRP